jgi:lectin-like protein
MGVGRRVLVTIAKGRTMGSCSLCFTQKSWVRSLSSLGLTLIAACTQLADPAERGEITLPVEGDESMTVRDGGVAPLPDEPSGGDEGLDEGSKAQLDAGKGVDRTPPSQLADAGPSETEDAAATVSPEDAGSSPADPGAPCPDGLSFEDSCYRPSRVPLSWEDARDDCLAGGGDLVSIDSVGEDAFIATLLGVTSWLGASDRELEGTFRWTDGRELAFTGWGPGQPDAFPGQNCVERRAEPGAPWFDVSCENLDFYVCERPLGR